MSLDVKLSKKALRKDKSALSRYDEYAFGFRRAAERGSKRDMEIYGMCMSDLDELLAVLGEP